MDAGQIQQFSEALSKVRALVVGDLMLDRYLWGNVSRISPEAPVPVVDIDRSDSRPGGAANVALNIKAMGAKASLCGIIGEDDNAQILKNRLQEAGFDHSLVMADPTRVTTTKTRIIGNNQQILRVDHENREQISEDLRNRILESLGIVIQDFDVVIFEDYDKGLLDAGLIAAITKMAVDAGCIVVVDPKYRNFLSYAGVSLFKPNLKELNEALNLRLKKGDIAGIVEAVMLLRQKMPHEATLVTLSENGVLTVDAKGGFVHQAAHFRKITDVSGAGDTVIGIMALALAAGQCLETAAAIANLAGGLVCEEVGVVPIDKARLLAEMAKL
jgi:rfaE bifunctional protein kinase chain/domain